MSTELDTQMQEAALLPAEQRTEMTPMQMVAMALERGATPDILKQMMDLRDREEARNAKLAFTRAVSAAKAEIKPIIKTREVDYTPQGKQRVNYRHEDLAGIDEQVTPILTKHGLSYRYESENGVDKPITVICVLEHVDGHSTRTPLSAGADTSGGKNSLQAIASAVTYLQRYTLKLALGLSVSHDDDGRAAGGDNAGVTQDQADELKKMIDDLAFEVDGKDADYAAWLQVFLDHMKVASIEAIPANLFGRAKDSIAATRKARLGK